jgi:hypothetical protein
MILSSLLERHTSQWHMYSGISFPRPICSLREPLQKWDHWEMTPVPRGRHSFWAFLAWEPAGYLQMLQPSDFPLTSDTYHFHITWGMEILIRVKVKGSPQVFQSSLSFLLTNLLPAMSLTLNASASTEMKPKASVHPGKTRGCYLVVLPLWMQSTPPTHLHHYSKITFCFHIVFLKKNPELVCSLPSWKDHCLRFN